MSYEFSSHLPIYIQLVDLFSHLIASGCWSEGDKVDSVREIALKYGVNPNTVQRALSELEREGLVYTERTSGRFITKDKKTISKVRNRLAAQSVEQFVAQMHSLGFQQTELIEMIKEKWSENDGVN